MPLSETALEAIGRKVLHARLGPLAGASEEVALALLDLALAASAAGPPARPASTAKLVWTGPDVRQSACRSTTAVLLELLASAEKEVLIAGYEFDHGAVVFEPLHEAMARRGVKATIYLDIRPAPGPRSKLDAYLAVAAHRFVAGNWPFGEPLPRLCYFPAGCQHGSRRSLHAKCVVVDRKRVLIGSANFTQRGHMRNVEVGVHLDDAALAAALAHQFESMLDGGELANLPAVLLSRESPPRAAEDETDDETDDAEVAAAGSPADRTELEALARELLVSEAATPLFFRLLAGGAPVPLVGQDIAGDGGAVLGTAELCWEAPRVAVLLPEQAGSRKKLEAAGWTCFPVAMADDELLALCDRVREEE